MSFGIVNAENIAIKDIINQYSKYRGEDLIISGEIKSLLFSETKTSFKKTIEINIPAGIDNEQVLNVSNQGNSGTNGGLSGDLHVFVNVRPHPIFERRGNDVWCEVPITFTQAALGDEIVVPTIDGRVSYQVREGTQPGDVFKLKSKGIPRIGGHGRGDQFVRVTIEVPKNLTAKQKEILKEFDSVAEEKNYQKRKTFVDRIKSMFGE